MAYEHEIVAMLAHPGYYEWKAHGIGFIKAYLDREKTVRLNIWHSRFIMPEITAMHTHPWGLRSQIVAGKLTNYRWDRVEGDSGPVFNEGRINCERFCGIEGEPNRVYLARRDAEVYTTGMTYSQQPHEIHHTEFEDGTMTVMTRTPAPEAGGIASVFWPVGTDYVDATSTWAWSDFKVAIAAALEQLTK